MQPLTFIVRPVLKIASLALYFVTLVTAYGGYMDPQWWTLPAMGVLVFPYFAMATLIVAAAWLICKKYIVGCIGIGVLLACGPTFTQALPFRFGNRAADSEKTFKMVTYNCLHLYDLHPVDSVNSRPIQFLTRCGADFICLQELYGPRTHEIPAKFKTQIDSLLKVYPYYTKDTEKEIEFFSKYPFKILPVKLSDDIKYGSVGAYRLNINGNELTVINVHLSSYLLSPSERDIITEVRNSNGMKKSLKEFEGTVYSKMRDAFAMRAKISKAIAEFAEKIEGNVIICGDFNDVPGSWTYRNFTKRGFEDAYAQTGFGHIITYNQHLMFFHIDQILYKGEIMPLYVRKERLSSSDHYPLIAEFEFL